MPISPLLLEELHQRRAAASTGGGAEKIAARKKKGLLTARERVDALFQPGSFLESGMHAQHDCHDFGMEEKSLPGDGVVTGVGYVDGRPVASFSHDFMIGGGALGRSAAGGVEVGSGQAQAKSSRPSPIRSRRAGRSAWATEKQP